MIYLDNAATTPISDRVYDSMERYYRKEFGNPGSLYDLGYTSAKAVRDARSYVADFIKADPRHVIFTSCGSESNNMVIKGTHQECWNRALPAVCAIAVSAVEHDSVLKSADYMYDCVYRVGVNGDGVVDPKDVESLLEEDNRIKLVSIMYVNNETGAVNDVRKIAEICHKHGALFHTDCTQAVGTFDLDVNAIGCDFLSFSAHKLHGPKGIGALYIRDKDTIVPLIHGGSNQEFGLRGGTENVPEIIGFGEACRGFYDRFYGDRENYNQYLYGLKNEFKNHLLHELKGKQYPLENIVFNARPFSHDGKVLSITFKGIDSEALMMALDMSGVCVSAGSACTSHEQKPSHVLLAMGISEEDARNTIRVSFSGMNTTEEVIEAAYKMSECVETLWERRV